MIDKILDDLYEYMNFMQKNSTAFIFLFTFLALVFMYIGSFNKHEENLDRMKRYYECVIVEITEEQVSEHKAKKYCSDAEREREEALHDYGEYLSESR